MNSDCSDCRNWEQYQVLFVQYVFLVQDLNLVLTLSPMVKISSVRKSDSILRTDAPCGQKKYDKYLN